MLFMLFLAIGIVIAFYTKSMMNKKLDYGFYGGDWCYSLYISHIPKDEQYTLHFFMCISIALIGGPSIAMFGELFGFFFCPISLQIMLGIIIVITFYGIFYTTLSLKQFDKKESRLLFILILTISAIFCTVSVNLYNHNVETVTDTVVENTVKRELLYFCNAPVQNVSGEFQINTGVFSSDASGNIDTVHEVTYWYVDEHGGGTFGTSPTDYSRIEFLEDGETPYVEIFYYYKFTKTVDNNTNREWVTKETRWSGYVYHLPKAVLEMPLK